MFVRLIARLFITLYKFECHLQGEGRQLHDVAPGLRRRRADGAVERERVDLEVVVVGQLDVELEDAVGAPHLRERDASHR